MLRFVDISSHQPVVDFEALQASGVAGVSIKCTGGTTYRNPEYARQLNGARASGLLIRHYHYLYESSLDGYPGRGPEAEADFFLSQLDWWTGEILDLDFEDPAMIGDQSGIVARWRDRVRARLGLTAHLYANRSDITEHLRDGAEAVTDMPLWLAHYWDSGLDYPPPPCPAPWSSYLSWQWSGGGPVAGIPNATDADWFYGSAEDWLACGTPAGEQPQQPTPPDEEAERAALLTFGETIPFPQRGTVQREGVVDLTGYQGSSAERYARYERLVVHRLAGTNQIMLLALWDQLRAEGRVTEY